MSDFDRLHGFLYGERLLMQRERAKMEPETLEEAVEIAEWVVDWEAAQHKEESIER